MATKRLIYANFAQHIANVELIPDQAGIVQWVLSHTPTVDAVEVVRCKDCIHWEKGDSKGGNSIEDLQWIGGCKWAKCCRREMDFCSCGERRNGE